MAEVAGRIISATATACASGFEKVGAESFTDAELLEVVLHLALPRVDTKELAKELLATFGSFSGVLAAPRERLAEVKGLASHERQRPQDHPGRGAAFCARQGRHATCRSSAHGRR